MTKPEDQQVEAKHSDGFVTVDKPADMVATLTPEAAREMAEQLRRAAEDAEQSREDKAEED